MLPHTGRSMIPKKRNYYITLYVKNTYLQCNHIVYDGEFFIVTGEASKHIDDPDMPTSSNIQTIQLIPDLNLSVILKGI